MANKCEEGPQMSHGHAVLCEGASLVGANGRSGAERFNGLKVFHQYLQISRLILAKVEQKVIQCILLGHALGRQSEGHGNRRDNGLIKVILRSLPRDTF